MTGASIEFLPQHCDPRLRSLAQYWGNLPSSPIGIPWRRDLDPLDLSPRTLPYIWMVDLERDPPGFRFRLCGTHLVRALGFDPTGRHYEDVFPDFQGSETQQALCRLRDTGEPSWRAGDPNLVFPSHDIRMLERIFLPMTGSGQRTDIVLAASVYRNLRGQEV